MSLNPEPEWMQTLTPRQRAEVNLAQHYAEHPHGTDGHSRLMLISYLAALLNLAERKGFDVTMIPQEVPPNTETR